MCEYYSVHKQWGYLLLNVHVRYLILICKIMCVFVQAVFTAQRELDVDGKFKIVLVKRFAQHENFALVFVILIWNL